jgi:dienelactone hydrolase
MTVIGALVAEPTELRARVNAAHRALVERVGCVLPVAAVGHCFGGLAVLELARSGAEVRAVASVHGGLATKQPATQIEARVLICTGAADPYANGEARAAIGASSKRPAPIGRCSCSAAHATASRCKAMPTTKPPIGVGGGPYSHCSTR